jgi:hypothetical protein
MKVGHTGTLGRFDVRERYTLGFHLFPIDSFLPVRNIYALWSRQALRRWACSPSSSSNSESRKRNEEKSESHAVGSMSARDRPFVVRYILYGEREALLY